MVMDGDDVVTRWCCAYIVVVVVVGGGEAMAIWRVSGENNGVTCRRSFIDSSAPQQYLLQLPKQSGRRNSH